MPFRLPPSMTVPERTSGNDPQPSLPGIFLRFDAMGAAFPPFLVPLSSPLLPFAVILLLSILPARGEIELTDLAILFLLDATAVGQPSQPGPHVNNGGPDDLTRLAGGDQMLLTVQMLDELHVVLEGQIAVRT